MRRLLIGWRAWPRLVVVAMLAASSARAQSTLPPYPPPPPGPAGSDETARCLCLNRDINALRVNLAATQQHYQAVKDELAELDARLDRERGQMDVNNPQSVAQFRELLARRDALFRRSTGPEFTTYSEATARYNARVNEYNAQCANRPQDPDIVARLTPTLACPPPQ